MTNEQKIRIASLRRAGCGYTVIARELGLTKSAISNYCRGNGLGSITEENGRKSLQSSPTHGNTPSLTVARQKKPAERCRITLSGFSRFEEMLYVNVTSGIFSTFG